MRLPCWIRRFIRPKQETLLEEVDRSRREVAERVAEVHQLTLTLRDGTRSGKHKTDQVLRAAEQAIRATRGLSSQRRGDSQ